MSGTEVFVQHYMPSGVQYTLTTGSSHYIGFIDDETVLKYPHLKGDWNKLEAEILLYQALGEHPRLVAFRGMHGDGLLLEYCANGSLRSYIQQHRLNNQERLRLCRQAIEGVIFFHSKNFIHCDINVENMLVDKDFNLKYCDLQGQLTDNSGDVVVPRKVFENAKSRMPNAADEEASKRTDIFALGTAIYHIVHGTDPFPELDPILDEDCIQTRFKMAHFPVIKFDIEDHVVRKCWSGEYSCAGDILRDLEACKV